MSNFTDFFAAGGGGGIGETLKVGDATYVNKMPLAEFVKDRFTIYRTGAYNYSSYRAIDPVDVDYSYSATMAGNNTWTTIADITSAANGGAFLHFCNFKYTSGNSSHQTTVRITIDGGTPVEYPFAAATTGQTAYDVMGYAFEWENNYYQYHSQQGFMSASGHPTSHGWAQDYSTNGYLRSTSASTSDNQNILQMTPNLAFATGKPFVHFTSSFKLEAKSASSYATSTTGYATIKTF